MPLLMLFVLVGLVILIVGSAGALLLSLYFVAAGVLSSLQWGTALNVQPWPIVGTVAGLMLRFSGWLLDRFTRAFRNPVPR